MKKPAPRQKTAHHDTCKLFGVIRNLFGVNCKVFHVHSIVRGEISRIEYVANISYRVV